MGKDQIRTLVIGETVRWLIKKTLYEGIVKDDLGDEVWVLKIKHGDKSVLKKVKIKRSIIITKEQETMDVKRKLLENKLKQKTKDQLLEMMESDSIKENEKSVIVEILLQKDVKSEDIPNFPAELKPNDDTQSTEDIEELAEIDTIDDTPPLVKEKVLHKQPLAKEEIELQKKQEKLKQKFEEKKASSTNKSQRKDVLLLNPAMLSIEEGFNTRFDFGDIDELMNSIIENGIRIPMRGYKEGEKFIIIDGHRRYVAVTKAIAKGYDIARIPFISEKKRTEEERIFDIILSNDGKQLTSLELGETYRRLINCGYNFTEIAKKIGKTIKHVSDMISVAESSKELKEMIKAGDVSATLVSEIKNAVKDDDRAEKIIKEKSAEKKEVAKETGKDIDKKVTKKDVRDIIEKRKDNTKNTEKHKDVDDIPENQNKKAEKVDEDGKKDIWDDDVKVTETMYPETVVRKLLQQQKDACKAVLPAVLGAKLDNVDLVL